MPQRDRGVRGKLDRRRREKGEKKRKEKKVAAQQAAVYNGPFRSGAFSGPS